MINSVKRTLGAAGFLLASGGIASAVPAVVGTDLNVRTGPGTGYAVIDTMPADATVEVIACYSGWCEVDWQGLDGFASRDYLDILAGAAVIAPPPSVAVAPGIVVYESRYYNRPAWTVAGRFIRRELRREWREDRRDARQDRRDFRRDVRQDRRRDARQDARQDRRRDARQDARQDRRRDARQDARQDRRRDVRQDRRQVRQDVRQDRRRDMRQDRRVQRRDVRQARPVQRREVRQNRPERRAANQRQQRAGR